LKSIDGTINMWNSFVSNTSGYYGAFVSNGRSWAVNGDREMTISDIAASKSVITVGAYASKLNFTNVSGQNLGYTGYVAKGDITPFSSHGPTADGRIKPDIAGPGMTIASALSSYDTSFSSTGQSYLFVVNVYHNPNNNRDYPFGQLSGTSMSSPAVSGIVAMMLQIKNDLTPDEVKDILAQTAIRDGFTGTLPPGGNNFWGNGKVNAYGAVKQVLFLLTGIKTDVETDLKCELYPNPNNGNFILKYSADKSENLSIEIFDIHGKSVCNYEWLVNDGENKMEIELQDKSKGIYFTKVASEKGSTVIKTMTD
jgi:subtilisin family serine protease